MTRLADGVYSLRLCLLSDKQHQADHRHGIMMHLAFFSLRCHVISLHTKRRITAKQREIFREEQTLGRGGWRTVSTLRSGRLLLVSLVILSTRMRPQLGDEGGDPTTQESKTKTYQVSPLHVRDTKTVTEALNTVYL